MQTKSYVYPDQIISSKFQEVIKESMEMIDSAFDSSWDGCYFVGFGADSSYCEISVGISPSYDDYALGYIIVDDRFIGVYSITDICYNSFIKIEDLPVELPEEYQHFLNEDEHSIFDPWGCKYRIHSSDSVELIHMGMF